MPNIVDLLKRARLPSFEEIKGTIPALEQLFAERVDKQGSSIQGKLEGAVNALKQKRAEAEVVPAPSFFGEQTSTPAPTMAPTATPTPTSTTKMTSGPVYMRGQGKTWVKVGDEWVDVTPPEDQKPREFGEGQEEAYIKPELYDALMSLVEDEQARMDLAELSGQESSYGYAGPHISDVEESYGPYHINLRAGRKNPETGRAFTMEEASDSKLATEYALREYQRTGGLGAWNPGAYPFYQEDLPKRARTKKYKRGK